jgi:hypothetical protein
MGWNKDAAVDYLIKHAGPTSKSKCAVYTRLAIAAGGINILNTEYAKDYGNSLLKAGFTALPSSSSPEKGDVVVIQPYPGSRCDRTKLCLPVENILGLATEETQYGQGELQALTITIFRCMLLPPGSYQMLR